MSCQDCRCLDLTRKSKWTGQSSDVNPSNEIVILLADLAPLRSNSCGFPNRGFLTDGLCFGRDLASMAERHNEKAKDCKGLSYLAKSETGDAHPFRSPYKATAGESKTLPVHVQLKSHSLGSKVVSAKTGLTLPFGES